MRRSASEIIRNLEMRIARLERQSNRDEYDTLISILVKEIDDDEENIELDLQGEIDVIIDEEGIDGGRVSIINLNKQRNKITFTIKTDKGSVNVAMSLKGSYFDTDVVKTAAMNS